MKLRRAVRDVILLALGACLYGFTVEAVKVSASRADGNFGGEVLVLPLMAGLVWLGWELRSRKNK
ncbi:MAG: hypothetical protein NC253_16210 [Ruminococcus sp.]|nr:hypothetical protein [Ruminococcus sp.]